MLRKKTQAVMFKLSFYVPQSLLDRLDRVHVVAHERGYELDLEREFARFLAATVTRCETRLSLGSNAASRGIAKKAASEPAEPGGQSVS